MNVCALLLLLVVSIPATAHAAIYSYERDFLADPPGSDHAEWMGGYYRFQQSGQTVTKDGTGGGIYQHVRLERDDAGPTLTVSLTLDTFASPEAGDYLANGFLIVITDGPMPSSGDAAIIYFDAFDPNDIKVVAETYETGSNAKNRQVIHGTDDTSWIQDATRIDHGGKRTMSFTVNTSTIDNYSGDPDWSSIGFADTVGFWLWADDLGQDQADYNNRVSYSDVDYGVNYFRPRGKSRLDVYTHDTIVIPEPAMGVLLLGGLVVAGLRRRP